MDDNVTSVNLESTFDISGSMRGSIRLARRSAMVLLDRGGSGSCRRLGERNGVGVKRWTSSALAASPGLNDSSELGRGPINVVVDDHRVEPLARDRFLGFGPGQPALDRFGIVRSACLEPAALL